MKILIGENCCGVLTSVPDLSAFNNGSNEVCFKVGPYNFCNAIRNLGKYHIDLIYHERIHWQFSQVIYTLHRH